MTEEVDRTRPVVDSLSEVTAFRQLIAGYEKFVADIDQRNASIDADIETLKATIAQREKTREQNMTVRSTKVAKLAGVRALVRQLEDAETAQIRAEEDQKLGAE